MNGIEFLEQAMDLFPHARRALLTAYADTDAAIAGDQRGRRRPLPAQAVGAAGGEALPGGRRAARRLAARPATRRSPKTKVVGHRWSRAVVRGPRLPGPQPGAVPLVRRRRAGRAAAARPRPAPSPSRRPGGGHRRTATPLVRPGLTELADAVGLSTAPAERLLRPGHRRRRAGRARRRGLRRLRGAARRCWSSAAPPAARPGRARGSRTTWASPTACPAASSPTGPGGRRVQVRRRGAHRPRRWSGSRRSGPARPVRFDDGGEVAAHAVVLATGVAYRAAGRRRASAELVGRGVYYGSAATEAPACAGDHVFIVGGANSAGQAAVFFSRHAAQVTLVVRGDSLEASMSQLPDRADRGHRQHRGPHLHARWSGATGDDHLRVRHPATTDDGRTEAGRAPGTCSSSSAPRR